MEAWDAGSFGNDTASDWVYALEECADLSFIEDTLQGILDVGGRYMNALDGAEAVAAAEVVAWLLGRPTPVDSDSQCVAEWVASHPLAPPPALVGKALAVIHRIQGRRSELAELWEKDAEWFTAMADLHARLTL
ncbi:MAG: DUF4259 domain-containing protein [Verrucomicrobiaceae bacterium]|nr:MAG: DUF4259 domain-containing protein [Verrucomicrobiaceae bacterium]